MKGRELGFKKSSFGKLGFGMLGMAIASTVFVSTTATAAKPCSYRAYKAYQSQAVKEFRWNESPLAMAVILPGMAIATALTLGARGNTPSD